MTDEMRYCQNCSAELHGEFCSSCGQRDRDIHIPVKELATEIIEVLPSFDRRLLRSLKPLLFKPGFLTLEYLSGKRKLYFSPFKLYFAVSFIFFLVSSLTDDADARQSAISSLSKDSSAVRTESDTAFVTVRSSNSSVKFTIQDSSQVESVFGPRIFTALNKLKENPNLLFDKIKEHRPKIIFLLMPVFAFLLQLLYLRSGTLYIKHLVFSFYFHSFIFIIFLLVDLVKLVHLPVLGYLSFPLYLAIPVNLYYGLKRAYGQSGWKTGIKFILLFSSYAITFLLTVSAAAFIILYFFYL